MVCYTLAVALLCGALSLWAGPTFAQSETPARIAVRDGAFLDTGTGAAFTPLGVNYYRVGELQDGKSGHATFCPRYYDRDFIEKMMADLEGWGFNTVRTFHVYHVGEGGILSSPQAREINPEYLDNVVHFLQQAQAHGIRVVFTWDIWMPPSDWWASQPLPSEEGCDLRDNWDPAMGVNGFRLHRGSVRTRANGIVALIEAIRAVDPGLLPVVLAWELENEVCVSATRAPLSARDGEFVFRGKPYRLSSDEETQALLDDILVQWADCCADAIHRADAEALVSASVFTFAAVGRGGPGTLGADRTDDERIPARPLALLRSKVDYVDVHLYAWKSAEMGVGGFLDRNLESVEWPQLQARARELGRPLMCGECGLFANYLRSAPNWQVINHELGLQCFEEHVTGLRERGLCGALYWPYGNPDSTPGDETPALVCHPQYGAVLRELWQRGW